MEKTLVSSRRLIKLALVMSLFLAIDFFKNSTISDRDRAQREDSIAEFRSLEIRIRQVSSK